MKIGRATMTCHTSPATRFTFGAHADAGGVNFCVFSRHATRVEPLLDAVADSPTPLMLPAIGGLNGVTAKGGFGVQCSKSSTHPIYFKVHARESRTGIV